MGTKQSPAKAPHVHESLLSPKVAFAGAVNREFLKLHEGLERNGFRQLPLGMVASPNSPSFLVRKHEAIYNRSGGSNYFVFVHVEEEGLRALFTNPGTSEMDAAAPASRVKIRRSTLGKSDGWAERTVDEILAEAAKKPMGAYHVVNHDHIGYVNGTDMRSSGYDDGKSSEYEAIRNFMLWNYDIHMGPTSHNFWNAALSRHISELEAQVGIVNVPGVELTLPYKLGAKNGPHIGVWFAHESAALSFWGEVLSHGNWEYAPFAPLVDPRRILDTLDRMAAGKEAASGVNHFVASNLLPGVGYGNRGLMGDYEWGYIDEMMRSHFQAMEAFNLGNPARQKILFKENGNGIATANRPYFTRMVEEAGFGGSALTPNLLCLAAAKYFSEKYGKWSYAGHDTHEYFDVKFDKYVSIINRPGRAFNVLDLGGLGIADGGRKPTPAEIIGLLLLPCAGGRMKPFIPVEYDARGRVNIAAGRMTDGPLDRAYELFSSMGTWAKMLPAMWHDFMDGVKSVVR